jgi:hypothetical protein
LTVVTICRGARYTLIALVAEHYGRPMIRILLHPTQHWVWLLVFAAVILSLIAAGFVLNKWLAASTPA